MELDTANTALNAAQAEYSAAQTAVAPRRRWADANAQLRRRRLPTTPGAALAAARTQLDPQKHRSPRQNRRS
ncbi:MAG: hypothetical protein ACLRZH_02615 [Ruthenibacterium lactatiformans]